MDSHFPPFGTPRTNRDFDRWLELRLAGLEPTPAEQQAHALSKNQMTVGQRAFIENLGRAALECLWAPEDAEIWQRFVRHVTAKALIAGPKQSRKAAWHFANQVAPVRSDPWNETPKTRNQPDQDPEKTSDPAGVGAPTSIESGSFPPTSALALLCSDAVYNQWLWGRVLCPVNKPVVSHKTRYIIDAVGRKAIHYIEAFMHTERTVQERVLEDLDLLIDSPGTWLAKHKEHHSVARVLDEVRRMGRSDRSDVHYQRICRSLQHFMAKQPDGQQKLVAYCLRKLFPAHVFDDEDSGETQNALVPWVKQGVEALWKDQMHHWPDCAQAILHNWPMDPAWSQKLGVTAWTGGLTEAKAKQGPLPLLRAAALRYKKKGHPSSTEVYLLVQEIRPMDLPLAKTARARLDQAIRRLNTRVKTWLGEYLLQLKN